jgi:hypothetical protein
MVQWLAGLRPDVFADGKSVVLILSRSAPCPCHGLRVTSTDLDSEPLFILPACTTVVHSLDPRVLSVLEAEV